MKGILLRTAVGGLLGGPGLAVAVATWSVLARRARRRSLLDTAAEVAACAAVASAVVPRRPPAALRRGPTRSAPRWDWPE